MDPELVKDFSQEEIIRYSRHLLIPDFQMKGQFALKKSRVLVIGAGGLGSPVLYYLAAAGVGHIGIVDGDTVDLSNLQRQILFDSTRVGKSKADEAAEKIRLLNPNVETRTYPTWLRSDNALQILENYDLVVDGSDNFQTRYLVNDACVLLGKPLVYGSIFQFEGQVTVFNLKDEAGERGPNYRDLFPEPPPPGLVPSCAEGGVLGVLPGIIGSMQANEAIKILTGIGATLSGRLFIFDALNFESITLKITKNDNLPPIEKLIDYEEFCGLKEDPGSSVVPEIQVEELAELMSTGATFTLIDVRETYEYALADIGGKKIPLSGIEDAVHLIPTDHKVIFYCRSGKRSTEAINRLNSIRAFDNLFNLSGGILAYIDIIDPSLNRY